jgi:hypothetical protein
LPANIPVELLDSGKGRINVSDYKGKAVILDFWDVECTVCIQNLPVMEVLQKQFKSELQIIPVTHNDEQKVKSLFKKIKRLRPGLPMVINDTVLSSYFPHWGNPYHIWIDRNGIIQYTSFNHNTTAQNVRSFLNGKTLNIPKLVDLTDIDPVEPIFPELARNLRPEIKYYSAFISHIPNAKFDKYLKIRNEPSGTETVSITALNLSISTLYSIAYSDQLFDVRLNIFNFTKNNRIIIEDRDSTAYYPPTDQIKQDEWKEKYSHSYELSLPKEKRQDMFAMMIQDLDRYFSLTSTIELREINCLVLVRTDSIDRIKSSNPGSEPTQSYADDHLIIKNKTIASSLIPLLIETYQALKTPVIDDTNYKNEIEIELNAPIYELPALKRELQKYGLGFVIRKKSIDMLVIKKVK